MSNLYDRALVDKNVDGEEAWLKVRRSGVTATEVRDLAKGNPARRAELLNEKRTGERNFFGNQWTKWGLEREPVLVEQYLEPAGFIGSDVVFHAEQNKRHLATPDGVYLRDGLISVAEIKTSKNDIRPDSVAFKLSGYYDQCQFQMYVCGADECLYVWELHEDFVVVDSGSEWIEFDGERVAHLVKVADEFLAELDGDVVDDPNDYDQLVADFARAQANLDVWNSRLDEIRAEILARIGERESFAITTSSGKVSLSPARVRESFDSAAFKDAQPDVYSQFVKQSAVKPVLRITPAKEESSNVL
jgi:hypothetical protein